METTEIIKELKFYQGLSDYFAENNVKVDRFKEVVKAKIAEFFNMKNVCFLFGAGVSCPAILNMAKLYSNLEKVIKGKSFEERFRKIAKANDNKLEDILSVLYSGRAYYQGFGDTHNKRVDSCSELIRFIEKFIFESINIHFNQPVEKDVLKTYESFYQKIAFRNKDLFLFLSSCKL